MEHSLAKHIPLDFERLTDDEMERRSRQVHSRLDARRSVRHFDSTPVPVEVLRNCIAAAGTAPSGAHKQPWTFCLVTNQEVKKAIREAAELEEYENYHGRMSERWLEDLKPFDTDYHKPHLDEAPALIVVFKQVWEPGLDPQGGKRQNYYVQESVGIACGMLLAALHESGLVALTHTPSPMDFLSKILNRPNYERAFLLIPVGYPIQDCLIPDIKRKSLQDILVEFE